MKKRLLAIVLALLTLCTLLSVSILAGIIPEENEMESFPWGDAVPEEPTVLIGDANGDGEITGRDATAIAKYVAGIIGEDEIDILAADANGDGEITGRDATAIAKHVAGIELLG